MKITRIYNGCKTILTFKVTGDFHNLTDEELIDRCDADNFGGHVYGRCATMVFVDVYID